MTKASVEGSLRAAQDKLAECRRSIKDGHANLAGIEQYVRDYCVAIARLPKDEGRLHESGLKTLMKDIEALETDLTNARDAVEAELAGLSRLKQANVAYHKSDSIGPVTRLPEEED